jgi:Uncharacterised protein family (UPF0259)
VTEPEWLDLAKPREIGELLGDALRIYRAHFGKVFAIALAIVAPVELIVSGVGLEELTSGYRDDDTAATLLIPWVVSVLVVAPLIAAAAIAVLQALSNGARPRFRQSIQLALDAFPPLFLAVLLASLAVALGLAMLIVPGIYIAVRLLFAPQSVVIDGARGLDALRASWKLTRGFWWRTFGVVFLANLVAILPGLLIVAPFQALAESADRQAISLAGVILTEALTAPFVALVSTLLFYELRSRRAAQVP